MLEHVDNIPQSALTETKVKLYLVIDNTKSKALRLPADAETFKPFVNDNRIMDFLTITTAGLEIGVCLMDNVRTHGEKVNGLYQEKKKRIYIDKRLKGRKLQFVLMHEIAHAILHTGKLGPHYWKDPAYREQLEDEANNYTATILNNLEGREVWPIQK